jgi:hypothetical protein
MEMSYLDRVVKLRKQRLARVAFDKILNEQIRLERVLKKAAEAAEAILTLDHSDDFKSRELFSHLSEFDNYELESGYYRYQLKINQIQCNDGIIISVYRIMTKTPGAKAVLGVPQTYSIFTCFYKNGYWCFYNNLGLKQFSTIDELMDHVVVLISSY